MSAPRDHDAHVLELDGVSYRYLALSGPRPDEGEGLLTGAERGVVRGVLAGWSNRRIARQRGVSERTVANQLASVYRKLGVRGRHELIRRATSTDAR